MPAELEDKQTSPVEEPSTPELETPPETTAEAPVETPPEPQPTTPPAPPAFALRDYLKSKGIDGFADDSAAAEALLQHARQGAVFQQQAMEYQRQLAAMQRQPQTPAEKPKGLLARKPPFDPRWETMVEKDAITGALKARPGAPPDILTKINDWLSWKAEYEEAFYNPEKFREELIGDEVEKRIEERMAAIEQRRQFDALWAANEKHLIQNGQITPFGQAFKHFGDKYAQAHQGQVNPLIQFEYAWSQAYMAQLQQQQTQQPTTPTDANAQHKQDVINAATRKPQTNGAQPAVKPRVEVNGGVRANPGASLREALNNAGFKEPKDYRYAWNPPEEQ